MLGDAEGPGFFQVRMFKMEEGGTITIKGNADYDIPGPANPSGDFEISVTRPEFGKYRVHAHIDINNFPDLSATKYLRWQEKNEYSWLVEKLGRDLGLFELFQPQ